MKTFEYRGYTVDGGRSKGLIEAMHPKAAKDALAKKGILVENLAESGVRSKRVSADLRAVLYRELAALLSAGMPLVTAIDTLVKTPEMKGIAGILGRVRDSVREGGSLSSALSGSRAAISGFEEATIEVAERTASLDTLLVQLADFIDEHQKMKERIQHAMIYPALVLGLGICVSIVMLGFLVPRTQQIMSGVATEMPLLTRIMLALGNGLWPWGIIAALVAVALTASWIRRISANRKLRIKYDRKIFNLPLIGAGYRLLVSVRFARTLAILVRSGVPPVEGLVLAGRSTGSPWVESLSMQESESLRHGAALSTTVRSIPPLAELLPGWIAVGEAGGSLAMMLDRAAERCQVHFERFLSRLLVLLEPALLLIIGGFVLLITLSVMLPMFSLSSAIAK